MISLGKTHKLLTILLIALAVVWPGVTDAKAKQKTVALPAPFHAREIKINGKTFVARDFYSRSGKLRYSLLTGANYHQILVDQNLDGTADIWEVQQGNKMFVARNPVHKRFMQIEFTEFMPKVKEKSLFVYNSKTDSYVLARATNEPYRILNLDTNVMNQLTFPPPPPTSTVSCGRPPLSATVSELLNFNDVQLMSGLECLVDAMKPLLFDKSCIDDPGYNSSLKDMSAGLLLILASSPLLESKVPGQLRGDKKDSYLGCVSTDLGMPLNAARIEQIISDKFAAMGETTKSLLTPQEQQQVGATFAALRSASSGSTPVTCTLPKTIADKLKKPLKRGNRLITCMKDDRATILSSWSEVNHNGQIVIHKKSADAAKAMGMSAPRAYASMFLHELTHGSDVSDEKYTRAVEKCCAPNDSLSRDVASCTTAQDETTRIKKYMLVTQTLLSGEFIGNQNDVYNNINADSNGTVAAGLMDDWTNEIASHQDEDSQAARNLPECKQDQNSQACKTAQTYYLQSKWRQYTKDFFESGKCEQSVGNYGLGPYICNKYKTQFDALVTVKQGNNNAFALYVQQADQVQFGTIASGNSYDPQLAIGLSSNPLSPGGALDLDSAAAELNNRQLYREIIEPKDEDKFDISSSTSTTNPTLSVPNAVDNPTRAVTASSVNSAGSASVASPVPMVQLGQASSSRPDNVTGVRSSEPMFRTLTAAADSARNAVLPSANAATRRADSDMRSNSPRSNANLPALRTPTAISFPAVNLNLGVPAISNSLSAAASSSASLSSTSPSRKTSAGSAAGSRGESSAGSVNSGGGSSSGMHTASNSPSQNQRQPQGQGGIRLTSIAQAESYLLGSYSSALRYLSQTNFQTGLYDLGLKVFDKAKQPHGCQKDCKRVYRYCPKTDKLAREGGC